MVVPATTETIGVAKGLVPTCTQALVAPLGKCGNPWPHTRLTVGSWLAVSPWNLYPDEDPGEEGKLEIPL